MREKFLADPANLIALEGVGEVPRPTDVDQQKTGFKRLVSLRIYTFTQGQVIHGEAEGDEVIVVLLQGSLTMSVEGPQTATWELEGRQSVFSGPAQAVYLPPGYTYRLELHTGAQVAYARARAEGRFPPRLIKAAAKESQESTEYKILGPGEAEALECFETLSPAGGRSTLPERVVQAESLTHYRLSPADASARYQTEGETDLRVQEGDTVASRGHSAEVSTPDGRLYGLTVFADSKS